MSGAARIQRQHIEVAHFAAPAALLRQQLARLGAELQPSPAELLLQNPVLLLQALAQAQAGTGLAPGVSAILRQQAPDPDALQALLRQNALQLVLAEDSPDQNFLTSHWLLSRRTALFAAALARQVGYPDPELAAACALLMRVGMLVLLQHHGAAYSSLALAHWPQQKLLNAEQAQWQDNHLALGEAVLDALGFDQFCVDALRYQALPLAQVLDATPLVKVCWFAARFANADLSQDQVLPEAGQLLPGLEAAVLMALPATIDQQLAAECNTLGLQAVDGARLPLTTAAHAAGARQQLLLLRQQLLAADLLARHGDSQAQTPAEVQTLLNAVLQDAGIEPVWLVLYSTAGTADTLQVLASNGVRPDPAGLTLVCASGRSALANLILRGEVDTLSAATADLVVIDHQLLHLLGGGTVLCEPVQSGNRRAVLLLALKSGASPYLTHASLRRLLRRTLQDVVRQTPDATSSAATLLYQQRVRDAVHEASNPLTIIKNFLQVITLKQGEDAELAAQLGLIKSEIDRVAGILNALREPEEAGTVVAELELNRLATGMLRMFEGAFGHGQEAGKQISLQLALASEPVRVVASTTALKQILTNLVKNAVEAIETSGIITISTRTNVWQQGRLYGQLTVADDGPGIAPALLQTLFSPGTTTRRSANKGAGLAIVKGLVEDQQGQISCQSDSKGTVLTILLPQAS